MKADQPDQNLRLALCIAMDPIFLQADNEGWPDFAHAQPDLSLR